MAINIRDFMDLKAFQALQDNFSDATGLAAIAVDMQGKYISSGSNFTDFCMKYTRGNPTGLARCVKCDNECSGVYFCHAGLMDFSIDIKIGDEKVGAIIGGQVLPAEPDLDKFRATAKEMGIDPEEYVAAVKKVPVRDEKQIRAAAKLLGDITNILVNLKYRQYMHSDKVSESATEIDRASEIIQVISKTTRDLRGIAQKQRILSLNASIEAARSGEAGAGFAVVAKSMQDLVGQSAEIYGTIESRVSAMSKIIDELSVVVKK